MQRRAIEPFCRGRRWMSEPKRLAGRCLRSLFSNCRAIGLCLYDGHRIPLKVIDGALATHPIVRSGGDYRTNPLYDPEVSGV